ncbi:hypothetical protein, partial [Streptomyces zhihengii]
MADEPSWIEMILMFLVFIGGPTLLAGALIAAVTGCVVGLKAWRAARRGAGRGSVIAAARSVYYEQEFLARTNSSSELGS